MGVVAGQEPPTVAEVSSMVPSRQRRLWTAGTSWFPSKGTKCRCLLWPTWGQAGLMSPAPGFRRPLATIAIQSPVRPLLCQGPNQEAPHIVLQGSEVKGICGPQHCQEVPISFFLEAGVGGTGCESPYLQGSSEARWLRILTLS